MKLTALLLAATGAQAATDCTADNLEGPWRVVTLAGQPLPPGAELTFLPDQRLAARLGCNRMIGGMTLAHGVLRAEAMAATRMACPADLMARDDRLAALLTAGAACRITDDGALHLGGLAAPDLTATR